MLRPYCSYHDVAEGLLVEVEVVGHKNRQVTLLDGLIAFGPVELKPTQVTIGMHNTELGCWQLLVEV